MEAALVRLREEGEGLCPLDVALMRRREEGVDCLGVGEAPPFRGEEEGLVDGDDESSGTGAKPL